MLITDKILNIFDTKIKLNQIKVALPIFKVIEESKKECEFLDTFFLLFFKKIG